MMPAGPFHTTTKAFENGGFMHSENASNVFRPAKLLRCNLKTQQPPVVLIGFGFEENSVREITCLEGLGHAILGNFV